MGFMVVRAEETKKIFLDEIAVLLIENPAVSLTGCLLEALCEKKIRVIFCNAKRNPSAELVPYYNSYDTPVEFSRYADETVQFAPFRLNRKSLLTKLYTAQEHNALQAEYYTQTNELLCKLESYVHAVADDFPFEVVCKKLTIGQVIKALSPEIEEDDKTTLEKIFAYMELVRELDRDRLFIMINMRSYFSDSDMENFIQTVCLHDFNVLLLESSSAPILKNTKRFTVDDDLCEF